MRSTLVIASAICMLAIFSCKKGDQGDKGDPGLDGNANAVQYNFGPLDLAANFFGILQINTTEDTMNNSSWHVYIYHGTIKRWYALPGSGVGGATNYRVSIGYENNKVNIFIDKSGAGEAYSKVRVIRIYNNKQINLGLLPGNKAIAGPDISNYEAMRAYYKLP